MITIYDISHGKKIYNTSNTPAVNLYGGLLSHCRAIFLFLSGWRNLDDRISISMSESIYDNLVSITIISNNPVLGLALFEPHVQGIITSFSSLCSMQT